jgi:hypothetical protein
MVARSRCERGSRGAGRLQRRGHRPTSLSQRFCCTRKPMRQRWRPVQCRHADEAVRAPALPKDPRRRLTSVIGASPAEPLTCRTAHPGAGASPWSPSPTSCLTAERPAPLEPRGVVSSPAGCPTRGDALSERCPDAAQSLPDQPPAERSRRIPARSAARARYNRCSAREENSARGDVVRGPRRLAGRHPRLVLVSVYRPQAWRRAERLAPLGLAERGYRLDNGAARSIQVEGRS